jgi:nucleotide-binding universal stress UspA family protein
MSQIIVPVDFSDTSAAALRFGTYLAEVMDLDLTAIHVFDTLISTSETLSEQVRERERERLDGELREFTRKNAQPVLATFQGSPETLPNIRTAIMEGVAAPTLLWQTTRDDVSLVIMGGVGAGAGKHPPGIFGSVARRLAMKAECPLILIPRGHGFPHVDRLAIAFEEAEDIRQVSGFSRKIITALHAEVHYVHVRGRDAALEDAREEEFLALSIGPGFPSYTYTFDRLPAGAVVQQLLDYTSREKINLLVLGGERRGFFEGLFRASHLGPLVKRCAIPLLIIPFAR